MELRQRFEGVDDLAVLWVMADNQINAKTLRFIDSLGLRERVHFGVDLAKPSDYIRRVMPNWEEPPVHQDLIAFDMTVMAGGETIIDSGFLVALRDPSVVEMAKRYGDPVELLEATSA